MKKLPLLLTICFLWTGLSLYAQTNPDLITEKKRLGPVFIQHDKPLTVKKMSILMQPIPDADAFMQKAKKSYNLGTAVGYVAGALIGWPLGTAIAGGKPEWALAGVGAGLIAVSIPISNSYSRNARQAVNIYNQQL